MGIDFVLANYVYAIAELPEHPDILLITDNEKQLLRDARCRYRAISLWLRHLLLGEVLAEEAFLTYMNHYQPIAELVAGEFRLAVGVHPRSSNPLIRGFKSPADLWFVCRLIMSEQCLENTGLITGVPLVKGKLEGLKENFQAIKGLEDLSVSYQLNTNIDNLSGILLIEAQEIAKTDIDFQKDYYRPHLRVMKRTANKIKNSKHLQSAHLLPNGEIFWTEKDRKLPKKM